VCYYCVLFTVCYLLCAIYYVLFTVCSYCVQLLCAITVCYLLCAIYCVLYLLCAICIMFLYPKMHELCELWELRGLQLLCAIYCVLFTVCSYCVLFAKCFSTLTCPNGLWFTPPMKPHLHILIV